MFDIQEIIATYWRWRVACADRVVRRIQWELDIETMRRAHLVRRMNEAGKRVAQ